MQRDLWGGKQKIMEDDVKQAVSDYLDSRGIRWWRNNTGRSFVGNRVIAYGKVGSGDILALWPTPPYKGVFWSIEIKRPEKGLLDDNQIKWLIETRQAGGFASVVEGVDDLLAVFVNPGYLPERYKRGIAAYCKQHKIECPAAWG